MRIMTLTNQHAGYSLQPQGQEEFTIIQYNVADQYTYARTTSSYSHLTVISTRTHAQLLSILNFLVFALQLMESLLEFTEYLNTLHLTLPNLEIQPN